MQLQKIIFYTSLITMILAVLVVGTYYYLLDHYAGEIENLMEIILAEQAEEQLPKNEEKSSNPKATEENSNNEATPALKTAEEDTTSQNKSTEKNSRTGNKPTNSEPLKENTTNNDTIKKLEEKYSPVFKNIDLKDQLFTIQMLRKFSAEELQEMYQLYAAGKESRGELLEKLEEKITPEEMQNIKEIFQKNKGLL